MCIRIFLATWLVMGAISSNLTAQNQPRTIGRIFWQDGDDHQIRWGDLQRGSEWKLTGETLANYPSLDSERQSLVQMEFADGVVLTGVHDDEDGQFGSGWVAIDAGVSQEAHGDHFHWRFDGKPTILKTVIDDQQGNPAHVYVYDEEFYLANDKKNGFTRVVPERLRDKSAASAATFVEAGGGHITLAVHANQVAYSTWIDREGDNAGRVDVVGLQNPSAQRYSFFLPSGGIHGATACAGKIFFAPTDGVYWVTADPQLSLKADDVQVNHISLGMDSKGNPRRTGAFSQIENHVLFTVGRGESPTLFAVDASSPKPNLISLKLPVAEGNSVTTPTTIRTRTGERFALLFEESPAGKGEEKLHVVALDPNRDGNFADLQLRTSIPVGKSNVSGHSGHHEAAAVGTRYVVITNPGDGTISVISTSDWQVLSTHSVGGSPTRLVAIGG